MIVDKSGSLASVKRNDYLPFGEELYANTGGRTTAQGYGGDSVREKFTGYEADSETALNFAQARYQSPTQGRFTSVDPLGASATISDPQSFNRYSYVQNNPTNFTDPTGMALSDIGVYQTDNQAEVRFLERKMVEGFSSGHQTTGTITALA
jgi:RHS repeat-associated protein